MDIQALIQKGSELALAYAPKVLLAIVVLIIGLWIIKRVVKLSGRSMENKGMEESLRGFLETLIGVLLKALLFISVASMIGIKTTSFVAILGAAGLAVGLALQGSLANFAGGVLILIFKPYKVGDLIETQGHTGFVKEILVFVTVLETPDSKTVVLPNGPVSNGPIVNYSTLDKLRVDLVVGIGYGEDIRKAQQLILESMQNDPKVMKDPAPSVTVLELGDSSVNLAVRPYATVENYWDVYFGTLKNAKIALDEAGIEIPFPQRVVHQANIPG